MNLTQSHREWGTKSKIALVPFVSPSLWLCVSVANLICLITSPGVRADSNGVARVKLKGDGKWFIKFIHMTKLDESNLDYESKWASLTFEIGR
jgi:hypothetical protein